MTILEAGKNLTIALTAIYEPREAANIAALAMEKITGFSNSERLVHKHVALNTVQQSEFEIFKTQLLQQRPVQYVLQEAWFCGMPFFVDESVLIPRPETEELVETIVGNIATPDGQNLSILDIGTGSGCIAISLKKKLWAINAFALDISENVLNIARKNAVTNKADIVFLENNILNFNSIDGLPIFDIIVSNPPYIKQTEAAAMHANVLLYEPHIALFVPDEDALLFYKAIADFSVQYLKRSSGKLYFEINEIMGDAIVELLHTKGFSKVQVKKDLQQKNRMVSASLQ